MSPCIATATLNAVLLSDCGITATNRPPPKWNNEPDRGKDSRRYSLTNERVRSSRCAESPEPLTSAKSIDACPEEVVTDTKACSISCKTGDDAFIRMEEPSWLDEASSDFAI